MPGTLVISLDFELMWGVRDRRSLADYGDAVLGGRQAIPQILKRFAENDIHATWATVGLLFARNRSEMMDFAPAILPAYADPRLSPYRSIELEIGADESTDKYHFGHSLLEMIAQTPQQEIGTHTYSHYYCLEPGQTLEAFSEDIRSAIAIARHFGTDIKSIVFPRNQMTKGHVEVCQENGIGVWRGNPGGVLHSARPIGEQSALIRAGRLVESLFPVNRLQGVSSSENGCCDVPASRFLRPHLRKLPAVSRQQLSCIKAEMKAAAQTGGLYHLWWHPHNFGRNIEANLAGLDAIISQFNLLRDEYGMMSCTMQEAAEAHQS